MLGRNIAISCLSTMLLYCGGITTATAASTIAGADWENYNKTLEGQRYSPLSQIDVANAGTIAEVCRVQVTKRGSFESGLLVVDGTMFATTAMDTIALDPTSCAVKWRHEYRRGQDPVLPINRGVAYLNGRLFRGTDDGRLIALDARTGNEIWSNVVGDPRLGEFVTGAPIAWNGLVIVGLAAGDFGVRGRIVAYDALSGREAWRFDTVPTEGQKGAETWKDGKWAAHGGGGSWSTLTIDPTTGELFIPVGNPVPDFSRSDRPGANLYTNSVLVLDAVTGKLRWWYQLTPDDGLDHDLAAAPMLFRSTAGENRVAAAGKDGYLHIISRATHGLLSKTPVTTVDAKTVLPTPEGVKACPGPAGGVEWNGPALDPGRMTIFVGAVDYCALFKSAPGGKWTPGGLAYGGTWSPLPDPATGWITAVNADDGKIRWKFHAEAAVVGGITPTAGGILIAGDNNGNFYIFNSNTGDVIKKIATGGSLSGGVITYEQSGKQYIAVASGSISKTVFGAVGRPSIVVMALAASPSEIASAANVADAVRGKTLFLGACAGCHGSDGKNIGGFDLTSVKSRMNGEQLTAWLKNPAPPMPKVFADPIDAEDEADIRDIVAFLRNWH
jgi:alcohol dehydrogenase (cytochrome c)